MEGEVIKWKIEADWARFEENQKILKGVKVQFYPEDKDSFTIKADDGLVKENVSLDNPTINATGKKDEIYLENNVQIIGYLDANIKCESLLWDSVSETMRSQDKVEVESEKWLIKGKGIEFAPSGDILFIKNDVTMRIN